MVNHRVDESLVKLVKSMEGDKELLQTIQILSSMCSMHQLRREMAPDTKISEEDYLHHCKSPDISCGEDL